MIGLPSGITACLFDLDGVLTSSAELHRAAWKETFDALLAERNGDDFVEFTERDYARYVDGRVRADGVRTFLESRGITLPEGAPDDPPSFDSVYAVGNRKNERILRIIAEGGVKPYPGSVEYMKAAEAAGFAIAVVTSSANGEAILASTGLDKHVRARIDGTTIAERGMPGKPAPDSFLAGAKELGVAPENAVVFEDALAGVEAGRAGKFGYVVGINREDAEHGKHLRERGADVVVNDLAELLEVRA